MTISTLTPGFGSNPSAPLFSRGQVDPDSAFGTAGGRTIWLRDMHFVRAPNQHWLCFAEAHEGNDDQGCGAIVMVRSTDDGASWGQAEEIFRLTAYDGVTEYVNAPCPGVYGGSKIILAFVRNKVRQYVISSTDNGYTWSGSSESDATEITTSLVRSSAVVLNKAITAIADQGGVFRITATGHGVPSSATGSDAYKVLLVADGTGNWAALNGTVVTASYVDANTLDLTGTTFGGTLSGTNTLTARMQWGLFTHNGLTTTGSAHAGRVMFPGDWRLTATTTGKSRSAIMAYTDDGVTFHAGASLDESNAANDNTNECAIAELPNNVIFMAIRNLDTAELFKATSTDGGDTWGNASTTSLGMNSTQPAVCAIGSTLYVSYISESAFRSHLKVIKSTDSGANWSGRVIYPGRSGYSDIEAIDSSTLMVIGERAPDYWDYGVWYQEIFPWRLPTSWLDASEAAEYSWPCNDLPSGTVAPSSSYQGAVLTDHGKYQQHAYLTTKGSFDASGIVLAGDGSTPPCYLAIWNSSQTQPTSIDPDTGSVTIFLDNTYFGTVVTNKRIFDTRNGSGRGMTILINPSARPTLTVSDGTNSTTATVTSGTYNDTTRRWWAFEHDRANNVNRIWMSTDGVSAYTLLATSAASSPGAYSGSIYATNNCTLGCSSNGSNALADMRVGSIRVVHDTMANIASPLPPATKETKATYVGASLTAAANAPSSISGCLMWLASAAHASAYYISPDQYGAALPGPIPRNKGQGLHTMRDVVTGKLLASTSLYRPSFLDYDSTVGWHIRNSWGGGYASAGMMRTPAAITTIDAIHTTQDWSIAATFKFIGDSADTAEVIIDNNADSAANPGFTLRRIVATHKLYMRVADGTSQIVDVGAISAGPTIANGTWYTVVLSCVSGTITGYYCAHVSGSRPSAMTSFAVDTMSGTGASASTQGLCLNNNSDSTRYGANIRYKDYAFFDSGLSSAQSLSLAQYASAGGHLQRIGLGIKIGL